ncbi:uncharacterized protein DSM5745_08764 [Aspergillus mulundensis]|uniref:Uncharacterized protein n=1 Tax=Aspergillus mulundensis TaxID=1810919 RepID=A0A3D8R5C0_9EURO|nr:hypothetical protein DSM5745_08764 [Aspergillus mulundensis]RDW69004.1 hypothetical protein DSM5745_08764 [Aspergillus mulundensis]
MSNVQCTRLQNQCDECRIARSRVPAWVDPSLLECPGYGVVFNCVYKGTRTQAEKAVEVIQSCASGAYGQKVRVHAAYRRSSDRDAKILEGPWIDITTPRPKGEKNGKSKNAAPSGLIYKAPKLLGLADPKQLYEKNYAKNRCVQCLVDFPSPIAQNGDIENIIIDRLTKEGFECGAIHPQSHSSLHRLKWWAETHPDKVPEEPPGSKHKPGEVRTRGNAWVRTKR